MVKLGIIGVGSMGSKHVENIVSGLVHDTVITAICDIDDLKMKKVIKDYNLNVLEFLNYKDLIESGSCEAILVCTPHYDHPAIAIYGLEHQRHVIIEKPAGVYTKKVQQMNEIALKNPHLKFGIMYNQRTNPLYQKVRSMVQNGELGEIYRTNWIITNWYRPNAYYNQATWRATWKYEGGGVLLNQDPHQLDLWQWICGMPKTVRAFCKFGSRRNIAVEDDVTCYVEYENKATGVFVTSVYEYPGTNRFEISGSKGQIIVEDGHLTFNKLEIDEREFNKENQEMFGKPKYAKIEYNLIENAWGNQHADLLNNFIEAILYGKELLAPGVEGIRGLSISNAMHISTIKNKEVEIDKLEEENFLELLQNKIEEEGLK